VTSLTRRHCHNTPPCGRFT